MDGLRKWSMCEEYYSFFCHNKTCHYCFSGIHYTELFAIVMFYYSLVSTTGMTTTQAEKTKMKLGNL